jgi:hypothetical protein
VEREAMERVSQNIFMTLSYSTTTTTPPFAPIPKEDFAASPKKKKKKKKNAKKTPHQSCIEYHILPLSYTSTGLMSSWAFYTLVTAVIGRTLQFCFFRRRGSHLVDILLAKRPTIKI